MKPTSFDTKVVHYKQDQTEVQNSKRTPIYQTSAFTFKDLDHLESYYEGASPYLYSRERNPNTDELAGTVAELEGAPAGLPHLPVCRLFSQVFSAQLNPVITSLQQKIFTAVRTL